MISDMVEETMGAAKQLTDLVAELVRRAEKLSRVRCPYRDRNDRCTARFACADREIAAGSVPVCGGVLSGHRAGYRL